MIIYVVTEDEIDYDFEETPYLTNIKLHRAFNKKEDAEKFVENKKLYGYSLEIKEVEFTISP